MNLGFVSKKFNAGSRLPRSIRAMRAISVAGIAIAVASLVVAVSIGRGFEKSYKKALLGLGAHVIVMGANEETDPEEVRAVIEKETQRDDVVSAEPFIYREGLVVGGGKIRGVVIKGVPREKAVAGKFLAEELGIKSSGGEIKLMIPRENSKGGAIAEYRTIRVMGTFESGMYDYDADFILMPMSDLREMFHIPAHVLAGVEIKLAEPENAAAISDKIRIALGHRYSVVTWEELNRDILYAVKLEKRVSAIIMGVMVMVSALNIIAVLVLMVIFRLGEISVLKAIGMKDRDVNGLLVRVGLRIGFIGTFLGVGIGAIVAFAVGRFELVPLEREIYLIGSLPVDISAPICGMITILCLGGIFVTTLIASRRFACVSIANGLRMAK